MISFAEFRPAPQPRPEIRTDATATLITALTAAAAGEAQSWAAGAVECAAGLWARCLSTADVAPAGVPVGPAWLAEVGHDLARRGEAIYLVHVAPRGRLRLLRATATDVWGDGPDPADWWYRLTITGPRTTRTVTAPAASVCHVRYATEPHSPARGLAPLQYASLTGTLAASLERSLGYEAGGAVARIVALPEGYNSQPPTADDGEPDTPSPGDNLAEAIRAAKGRTLLPETTAGSYGDTGAHPPRRDWEPARLGAAPPQALVQLRQHVESSVLACFGVPAPLGPQGVNDGTAMRESIRRLWTTTIVPLASMIAEELSRVLDRTVLLEHGQAGGLTDVAARARAVAALVDKGGMPLADAVRRVGWGGGDA